MATPAPASPGRPRALLANLGLLFAVTSPVILLVVPFLSPQYGHHVSVMLQRSLAWGMLLWVAMALVLPALALWRARRSPEVHGGAGRARISLAVLFGGFCVVAIAVPPAHGPRWEAYAAAEIRTLISAQVAYNASVGGAGYATVECLARADACIPGYTGPAFLQPSFAAAQERHMHLFTFYPGPPIDAALARERKLPATTMQRFAFVAIPWSPEVSPRSLCGDDSGVLCWVEGSSLQAKDGRCPEGCTSLQ